MKKCKTCQMEKEIKSSFSLQKSRGKEYVNNICKECSKEKQKIYRKNNKDNKKKIDKNYYERMKITPEFINKNKEYRESKKEEKSLYDKQYRLSHKEQYKNY